MIVLDGSPGAGKTTLLGRLLEAHPGSTVIFPEAQPPDNATSDAEAARHLLDEDLARTHTARRLADTRPGLIIASDRCHLGVLAYRHALWRTGRGHRQDLDHAIDLCLELRLVDEHRGDTIIVLLADPAESLRRRAAFAHDSRYAIWYDPDFLVAYNDAVTDLAATFTTDATVVIHDATHDTAVPPLLELVRDCRPSPHQPTADLPCRRGCPEPRSLTVSTPAGPAQLYASSLHVKHDNRTLCLRTAADIESRFTRRQ